MEFNEEIINKEIFNIELTQKDVDQILIDWVKCNYWSRLPHESSEYSVQMLSCLDGGLILGFREPNGAIIKVVHDKIKQTDDTSGK